MQTTLERWSQWAFRVSAVSVIGLIAFLTVRDQSNPTKKEIEDANYLDKMESFVKVQKARQAQFKPQIADDQRAAREMFRGIPQQAPKNPGVRG